MADVLISQLPKTNTAGDSDLLIIDSYDAASGGIVTQAIKWSDLYGKITTFPQGIKFPDGTALQPSITFLEDDNTGIYRQRDDTIGISTAGLPRLVIDPVGNVGINTLYPTEKLHIENGNLKISFSASNELIFTAADGGASIRELNALPLTFATNDLTRMQISPLGNLLVGTDNEVGGARIVVDGGPINVVGGTFTGEAGGIVKIGYNTGTGKTLLELNYEGAIANGNGEYGVAGQVLTSGGSGAPFTWTNAGTGSGGGSGTNPGPTPPTSPNTGDLWYDINNDILFVWNGSSWQEVSGSGGGTNVGPNPPTNPVEGELWWDSANNLLYGWDNTADDWVLVGPQDITDGVTPTITIGSTTTGLAGTDAIVTDTGNAPDVELNFTIPRGDAGQDGESATVALGTVATGAAGTDVIITNSGADEHNAVFNFTIPRGDKGDAGEDGTSVKLLGTVPTFADLANIVDPVGGDLWVVVDDTANGGTGEDYHAYVYDETDADWEFVGPIQGPAGSQGEAATITVGTTTTGDAGTNASVLNTGDVNDAVLEFTIPRGDTGEAATVTVGTTTTGDAGTNASVTNSGDENAAILDFTIPRGEQGEPGTGIQLQGSFDYVGPPTQSPEADNPQDGDLWVDVDGNGWAWDGNNWNNVGAIQGPSGDAATVNVGTTTTGDAGTNASVTNSGNENAAILDFTIPRGDAGEDGINATVALGTVATGAEGTDVIITNSGADENNAVFNFTIPRGDKGDAGDPGTGIQLQGSFNYVGPPTQSPEVDNPQDGDLWIDSEGNGWAYDGANWNNVGPIQGPEGEQGEAATITVGQTTTGDAGTNASVINTGDVNDAVLEFTIPRGEDGTAATVTVGTTTTGDAGTDASVTNSGDETGAILDFTIPRGEDGDAATVDVHSTETGDPGTEAIVTNEGTTSAAQFKFVIPRGDKGEQGDPQKVFVNATAPDNPEEGDLWWDTDEDQLHIYVDGAWLEMGGGSANINVDPIEPTDPSIGDLWYDPDTNTLYVYNGTSWDPILTDDSNYVTINTAEEITGQKTFTQVILGSAQSCEKEVKSGKGLSGGGKLTTDLELTVDAGNGLGFDVNDNLVVKAGDDTITVDAAGVKVNVNEIFDNDPYTAVVVTSFNGRKGDVDPADDDYSLGQLKDVDLTNSQSGYVLTQVGSEWHPAPMRIEGSLHFKGQIDANTATAPSAELGDFWVNTGDLGTVLNDPSWGILAGDPINDGDLIAKGEDVDGQPPTWVILGSLGTEIGVAAVTAQNGVVDLGTATHPVLEADGTVVRTTGDFTLAGDITFNGDVTFNGEINGDISGNADGVNVSILAGEGLVGGGLLTEDRTLSVNHDSTLQIVNDELGVVVGAGGGLQIDPYLGIIIDVDYIDNIIDNNPNATAGDGAIGLSVKTNGGLTVTGENASANQTDDTAWEIECDNTVVRTMGDQQIAGEKTFNDLMTVSANMELSEGSKIIMNKTSVIDLALLEELPALP